MKRSMIILLFSAVLVFSLSSASLAGMYLFGYTPGGQLGGGLRFDLADGVVADLSAAGGSGDSGATYLLYGDVFWGNWGLGALAKQVAVDADPAYELSLQYALEQAVNESISVGVLIMLVNYDSAPDADPDFTFGSSIVPYFVLAL